MCLIVDASVVSFILGDEPSADFLPVLKWLFTRNNVCLVYGSMLKEELGRNGHARRLQGARVALGLGAQRHGRH